MSSFFSFILDVAEGYERGRVVGEVSNILSKPMAEAQVDILAAAVIKSHADLDIYEAFLEQSSRTAWTQRTRGKAAELLRMLQSVRYA